MDEEQDTVAAFSPCLQVLRVRASKATSAYVS